MASQRPASGLADELWNIYTNQPVWDGCVISKRTKYELIRQGLAICKQGYTTLTEKGHQLIEGEDAD